MSDNKTVIAAAIIGLIGTLGAAIIAKDQVIVKTTSPVSTRPDPTIAVRDHYEGIRGGSYHAAWERLPQKIKNNSRMHPNGYSSFRDWFASINPIQVIALQVTDQYDDNATVKVTYFSDSKSQSFYILYKFKWNSQRDYWEFVDIIPI